MRICRLILLFCLFSFEGSSSHAQSTPSWSNLVPNPVRYKKEESSKGICWGTSTALGLLIPLHCINEEEAIVGHLAKGRDYVYIHEKSQKNSTIREREIIENDKHVGERLWVKRETQWTSVRIIASDASSYLIEAIDPNPFCPGDSGAPAWGLEEGIPKWSGMVISSDADGCSNRVIILKARAIQW